MSTNPAAIRLTRTGASSSPRVAISGERNGGGRDDPELNADLRAPVPPMKISEPPGLILSAALRATSSERTVVAEHVGALLCIHIDQGP